MALQLPLEPPQCLALCRQRPHESPTSVVHCRHEQCCLQGPADHPSMRPVCRLGIVGRRLASAAAAPARGLLEPATLSERLNMHCALYPTHVSAGEQPGCCQALTGTAVRGAVYMCAQLVLSTCVLLPGSPRPKRRAPRSNQRRPNSMRTCHKQRVHAGPEATTCMNPSIAPGACVHVHAP